MLSYKFIFFIILILGLTNAIMVISPVSKDVKNDDSVDLGTIGPGQTVSMQINPFVYGGGRFGNGGKYDLAVVTSLPQNWKYVDSKLYGNPLEVFITADPAATEGEYTAKVTIVDENYGEGLYNNTINLKVRITKDVLSIEVTPTQLISGPEQPARFNVKIENKGSAADVFELNTEGSRRWAFKKLVYVAAHSTKNVVYEIAQKEEGSFNFKINVVSTASNAIKDQKDVSLRVKSGLFGDYKATNNGIIIFPFFESSIYALAGLLSNLY